MPGRLRAAAGRALPRPDRPRRRRRLPRRGDPRRDRPLRLRLRRGGARDPGRPAAHRRAVRVRRAHRRDRWSRRSRARAATTATPATTRRRSCCGWPRCGRSWREVRRDRPHLHAHARAPTRASPRRSGRRSATPARWSTSGAGTGNYEPPDREVTAVEPSAVMIAQRPAGRRAGRAGERRGAAVRGRQLRRRDGGAHAPPLERLARRDRGDAARRAGASSLLSWDPSFAAPAVDHRRLLPDRGRRGGRRSRASPTRRRAVRATRVTPSRSRTTARTASTAPTGGARTPTSTPRCAPASRCWPSAPPEELAPGLARLRGGPAQSGAWAERHADLLERDELDLGYRLLVA